MSRDARHRDARTAAPPSLIVGVVGAGTMGAGIAQAALAVGHHVLLNDTEHQAIALKLGEMATRARAARLLTLDAAAAFDRGDRCDMEAGMAKYFASEAALENSTESLRIHGAYGYSKEYDIERLYRDAPLLQPLHESAATGKPIAWQRVHDLPDFVFFDHSVHVAKGVGCVECHGRVDQMPLTWRAQPLQMQWCLACHRDPAPHLRPSAQVFDMKSVAPGGAEGRRLAQALHVESTRRLTDCSTCHR